MLFLFSFHFSFSHFSTSSSTYFSYLPSLFFMLYFYLILFQLLK